MKTEKQIRYCTECGTQLLTRRVGAEKYGPWEAWGHLHYSKFDKVTGKRQYMREYYCPKKRWWNSHTQYAQKLNFV